MLKYLPKALYHYSILSKIKVVIMMMFATLAGMLITPKHLQQPITMMLGLAGILLHALCSAALNQIYESDIDHKMQRTQHRPLAKKTLNKHKTTYVVYSTFLMGTGILWYGTNTLATLLSVLTTFAYAIIYTRVLKPLTPQNIVIGGLSGAMPPLLGWTCLQPSIDVAPMILGLIIFAWTPAHFWPLAIHNLADYQKAQLPMLPVTHGVDFTTLCIVAYTILTAATSLLPFCVGLCSYIYLICACLLNIKFIHMAFTLHRTKKHPMHMFGYSIIYLYVLFSLLVIDHYFLLSV